MARIEIGQYLVTDTRVCRGRLIFKGTRVLVADVLALLKAGFAPEQIAKEDRGLVTPEAVREALAIRNSVGTAHPTRKRQLRVAGHRVLAQSSFTRETLPAAARRSDPRQRCGAPLR
jgi:uncharacterized protein (DUF433 family)